MREEYLAFVSWFIDVSSSFCQGKWKHKKDLEAVSETLFGQAGVCTYLQHIPSLKAQLIFSRSSEIKLGDGFHPVSWGQSKAGRSNIRYLSASMSYWDCGIQPLES